jgi:hypothetical protein
LYAPTVYMGYVNGRFLALNPYGNLVQGIYPDPVTWGWNADWNVYETSYSCVASMQYVSPSPTVGEVTTAYGTYATGVTTTSGWKFKQDSTPATRFSIMGSGEFRWYMDNTSGAGGTAGGAITWIRPMTLDINKNLLLNTTSSPASAVGTIVMGNATAPSTYITGGILYVESGALKFRGSSGTITTIAPA